MRQYTVVLTPDPTRGGYTATVPALAMAKDAIELYVESLIAHGEPVPADIAEQPLVELVRLAS